MTKKEVNKLKEIIKTVQDAFLLINKATTDQEADIKFIFGDSTNPTWAPEDHVHVGGSGMIIDIKPSSDGIKFRHNNWVNCFGNKIYGLLANDYETICTYKSSYYKAKNKNGKTEWFIKPIWVNNNSEPYLVDTIVNAVVRYLLDEFNIANVKLKMKELNLLRAKREFGFDFENSYYRTAKTIIKDYSDRPKFEDN